MNETRGQRMDQNDIQRELQRLSERLSRIESRLGVEPSTPTPPAAPELRPSATGPPAESIPAASDPVASSPHSRPGAGFAEMGAVPPIIRPPAAPPLTQSVAAFGGSGEQPREVDDRARRELTSTASPPAADSPSAPAWPARSIITEAAKQTERDTSLEVLIGGRWMAWAGAIILVVAVGFFVKLAYDQDWFGRLPPSVRCLAAAAFGAMLVIAGEWAMRRISRDAAVGLFGAGVGTLYLTAYASYEYYKLLSPAEAFVLMGLTALLGFGVGLRGRMTTIGVLSALGGYLSPVLLRNASASPHALPMYLTMLLAVALALSAALPAAFRPLRFVALTCHASVGLLWALDAIGKPEQLTMTFVFLCVWWSMVTAEVVWAARRDQSPEGNAIASLFSTLWFVSIGCWVLRTMPGGADLMGTFCLIIAAAAITTAMQFGTGLAALRTLPASALARLSMVLWVQSGALLAVAAWLQFDDYGQTIAWLAMAVACVEAGRRLRSEGVDVFGLLVGAAAVLRLWIFDHRLAAFNAPRWTIGDVTISSWAVLALAAAAAFQIVARRLRSDGPHAWLDLPIAVCALGLVQWMALCTQQCRGVSITGGWVLGCIALVVFEPFGRRQRYLEIALLVLVATAGRWLIYDAVLARMAADWKPAASLPVLNGQMGVAAAIALVGWWAARMLRRRHDAPDTGLARIGDSTAWQATLIVVIVFLLIALSFEVDRAVAAAALAGRVVNWSVDHLRLLMLTLLWTVAAVGIGITTMSVARPDADVGHRPFTLLAKFAWVLLILCGIKWMVVDAPFTFMWANTHPARSAWPLVNAQMLVGLTLASGAMLLFSMSGLSRKAGEAATGGTVGVSGTEVPLARWLPVASCVLLLWGLSFEVDRAIARFESAGGASIWPAQQHRALWWTLLWSVGGAGMCGYGKTRGWPAMVASGSTISLIAAVVWLTLDTLAWRTTSGVVLAPIGVNLQFGVGMASAALLWMVIALVRRFARPVSAALPATDAPAAPSPWTQHIVLGWGLIIAIGLWLGSLELDRFFAPEARRVAHADMLRQTALSIYWGLYAIGLIALGFVRRLPSVRYAGLVLLPLTLVKVIAIDMAEVRYVYRVLSLLGVGLLFVATSVAYARLAPRLLGAPTPAPPEPRPN